MSCTEPKTGLALQPKYQRQAPIAANADVRRPAANLKLTLTITTKLLRNECPKISGSGGTTTLLSPILHKRSQRVYLSDQNLLRIIETEETNNMKSVRWRLTNGHWRRLGIRITSARLVSPFWNCLLKLNINCRFWKSQPGQKLSYLPPPKLPQS